MQDPCPKLWKQDKRVETIPAEGYVGEQSEPWQDHRGCPHPEWGTVHPD